MTSIRRLAGIPPSPEIRAVLLDHYGGNVPPLHVEAFRALRKYELPRQLVEEATSNPDVDIQREAWRQMKLRYDVGTPIDTKWRLYPYSRNEDIGTVIALIAVVSAIIMALTAFITPAVAATFWKSLALFVVGAVASVASWGFIALLVISSQHGNAFADGDFQKALIIMIAVLWVLIGISWFSAVRAYRKRNA